MRIMKPLATACLIVGLSAAPVIAQESEEEGFSLMEEGARLILKGLMDEMEPALNELDQMTGEIEPFLKEFASEMGPALRDLMSKVEDWSAYHPPEILPNGDIILRRKVEQESEGKPEGKGAEIEL
jgi:hypothetical protein